MDCHSNTKASDGEWRSSFCPVSGLKFGLINTGAGDVSGSGDGVTVAAGAAGFFVADGFGVPAAMAAWVGVAACTVSVRPTVGSGEMLGAAEVAVAGGGVAVTTTVMTWGGCVGTCVGVAELQPTMNTETTRTIVNKSALFMVVLPFWSCERYH